MLQKRRWVALTASFEKIDFRNFYRLVTIHSCWHSLTLRQMVAPDKTPAFVLLRIGWTESSRYFGASNVPAFVLVFTLLQDRRFWNLYKNTWFWPSIECTWCILKTGVFFDSKKNMDLIGFNLEKDVEIEWKFKNYVGKDSYKNFAVEYWHEIRWTGGKQYDVVNILAKNGQSREN